MVNLLIRINAYAHLRNAFQVYGIEGTEQKIKELMTGKLREFMLARYRDLLQK